jgi:hypothetical protein
LLDVEGERSVRRWKQRVFIVGLFIFLKRNKAWLYLDGSDSIRKKTNGTEEEDITEVEKHLGRGRRKPSKPSKSTPHKNTENKGKKKKNQLFQNSGM